MRNISIRGMIPEELGLRLECVMHGFVRVDILLAAVHDADEAKLEGIDATRENIKCVRAGVHQVELGEHANRAAALRVNGPRKLE
jgi:hypothetical protein